MERLRATLRNATDNVPFYRRKLDEARRGARRPELPRRRLGDLPFTTKIDLRDHYPFGMFAVPRDRARARARLVGHDRQPHHGRLHGRRHRRSGPTSSPAPWPPAACSPATCCRTPTATACSPAASACTTAASASAPPSCRSPAATPSASSSSCATSASRPFAARRRMPSTWPKRRATAAAARRPAHPRRLPRRRALDQRDAPPDRRRPGHRRARHLRPLRDGRARASPSSAAARPACT